jgi:uncharacterized membrane protein YraQ (UPF0718 family)
VLTAAVSLRKQGATKGATTAFLISTPESGLDSIAVTYALLDPILTIARPVAAFITAFVAGVIENLFSDRSGKAEIPPHHPCPVDGCCDGIDCAPEVHKSHHSFAEKLRSGVRYAVFELWADIAAWFFIGLLLAGAIAAIVPEEAIGRTVGAGLPAMLIMLAVGVPLYICATASTPIAAALILKGISPGAALVFLLAGPATNVATLTVLVNILGKRATLIYLLAIAVCAVLFGLAVDQVYAILGISAKAIAGKAAEIIPAGAQWVSAAVVLVLSVKPVAAQLCALFKRCRPSEEEHAVVATPAPATDTTSVPPARSGST